MNHIALDAATEILSVALRVDEGRHRYVAVREIGLRHTQRLMPLVDALLTEAGIRPQEIDLVSCTRGPGSFTGLRIGMSTAKGLAAAIARGDRPPLVSVSTLDVMASRLAAPGTIVLPVIDARKGRFYGAAYVGGGEVGLAGHGSRRLTDDLDLPAAELLRKARAAAAESGVPVTAALIVTGPHADRFMSGLPTSERVVGDPGFRAGWADALLDCAERALATDGYDEIERGPTYVRISDAELGRLLH